MSIIDIILLICFIPAFFNGWKKGLIRQIIVIISFFISLVAAHALTADTARWMGGYIEASESMLKFISFIVIVASVCLTASLLGRSLEGLLNLIRLGWINKLLGVIFALMKISLFIGLALTVFNWANGTFELISQETIDKSLLYTPILNVSDSIFSHLLTILINA